MKTFRPQLQEDNLSSSSDTNCLLLSESTSSEGSIVDGGLTQPAGLILSVVYAGQEPILNPCIAFIQHIGSTQDAMKHSETVSLETHGVNNLQGK